MPPPTTTTTGKEGKQGGGGEGKPDPRKALERHLSALEVESVGDKIMEEEMKEDYKNPDDENSEDQGREIEHLLLTTHGIGQRLSERIASVNFVHGGYTPHCEWRCGANVGRRECVSKNPQERLRLLP